MQKSTIVLPLLFSMVAFNASAGEMGGIPDLDTQVDMTKVITLSGGVAFANPGETQTLYLNQVPGLYNVYNSESNNRTMGTGDLFFALQTPWYFGLYTQAGVSIGLTSQAKLEGDVNVNNLADIAEYQYRLIHSYISGRVKFMSNPNWFLQPYVTATAGAAYNQSYGFQTIPEVNVAISPPWYQSNTIWTFTWSAGAGVQKTLSQNWQVGLGYEFTDWGRSQLGAALSPWQVNGLILKHTYANQLLASISYLC